MALSIPESTAAASIANQLVQSINAMIKHVTSIMQNGQPANPALGYPAVTGADIITALGTANTAALQTALAALSPS